MPRRKREEDVDRAEPKTPEDTVVDAFNRLMCEPQPIMVTAWISIVEFIDADGEMQLTAFGSDMPSWRAQGIIDAGAEMLLEDE